MSHIRVLICRVDDPATDQMTELAAFDLPTPDVATLEPTTALDNLETVTQQTLNAILRRLLQAQWDVIDAARLAEHRQHCPSQAVTADGHEPVTVASRFTQRVPALTLSRQVCQQGDPATHVLPGNAVLPLHHGIIITRGLQEWACLLPQELPFVSVARLLGWQTHEAPILGETTVRSLVRSHAQLIRQAEQTEVKALATRSDLATLDLRLVPHEQPRRRAGWPPELNAAVDAALAREQVRPPEGVSWADWERGKGRAADGGDLFCRGLAPPRTRTGIGSGAPERRRSAHAPAGSRTFSGAAHRVPQDGSGRVVLQRCRSGVPPAPAGVSGAGAGRARLPAPDRRRSAPPSAASSQKCSEKSRRKR